MRILLTGSEGFIGKVLMKKLRDLGHEVIGMDIKRDCLLDDISKEVNVECAVKNTMPEFIIHLGALAGVRKSLEIPDKYFETNVTGTYWLLKWAKKMGVKKFLFASSSSVYGGKESPLKENMNCDSQLSPYAVSKRSAELVCKMFSKYLPVIVFRPFTVYGTNGRQDMVVGELLKAGKEGREFIKYGDGNSARGYTHVEDLTDGIIKLLNYEPNEGFDIFNIGGSEVVKLNELIEIVKENYPKLKIKEIKMPDVDVYYSYADISKMKEKVGWQPIKKFKEEIKKLCSI